MPAPEKKAQERMDIRLPAKTKAKLKKACALAGMTSLSEYVLGAAESEADRIISEHSTLVLEADVFDRFMAACEKVTPPNAALKRAAELAHERGIE